MWLQALAAGHLYGAFRLALLHGPVWDPLSVGYCLKISPESHQEALISKHKNKSYTISESVSFRPVLPSLVDLELRLIFLLQFPLLPNVDLEKQQDLQQKQELGWLHVHMFPPQSCLGHNLVKEKMWVCISMEIRTWEASEKFWALCSAICFILNGRAAKNQCGIF